MYRALSTVAADVISAFSSDGRIAADKLAVLTDPKGAAPQRPREGQSWEGSGTSLKYIGYSAPRLRTQ